VDYQSIIESVVSFTVLGVIIKIADMLLKRRGVSLNELDKIIERIRQENDRLVLRVEAAEENEKLCREKAEQMIVELQDLRRWQAEMNQMMHDVKRIRGEQDKEIEDE